MACKAMKRVSVVVLCCSSRAEQDRRRFSHLAFKAMDYHVMNTFAEMKQGMIFVLLCSEREPH